MSTRAPAAAGPSPEGERAASGARPRRPRRGTTGVQLGADVVRAMILEGAARVFVARGVRAVSIDDLLAAARISRRTFYRVYGSKDEVLLELYALGTGRLLDACRAAFREETDLRCALRRCVDAHLATACSEPRLVFILGGEAHDPESPLHARRVQVHAELAALIAHRARASLPACQPPGTPEELRYRALILALEGVTRLVLEEGDLGRAVPPEAFARARTLMLQLTSAVLSSDLL